jgi:predicted acyltransferase
MIKPERILSVDLLRGLTIACMILVNNPGSWGNIYPPFEHSHWNGCTPTDLVFPFFLFIVGISISYSLSAAKLSTENQSKLILKIVKRSAIIFFLGFLLNILPNFDFAHVRILGVLQRISIVFLISAFLFLKTSVRTQVIISIGILILYWILMSFVPVPGIGLPNLEPAANLGAWLDNIILNGHLWGQSKVWDPEGILSTMPAVASGLIGVITGTWLRTDLDKKDKILKMFVTANLLIVLGLAWDMIFPINKSLWTSSFVLYTSGIALNVLSVIYWFVDIKESKKYPGVFLAFGSNAIASYMIAELTAILLYSVKISYNGTETSLKEIIFQSLNTGWIDPRLISLMLALLFVSLIALPIILMYKKKIFIKV